MLLRRFASLSVLLALAACTNVTSEPQTSDVVFATFNSTTGVIPVPSDLALQAAPTLVQPAQAAQKELLQAFIAAGGFPSDQEVPVTIPINQVRWDPTAGASGGYVASAAPTVDATTVTAKTVAVYRVDVSPPVAVDVEAVASPGVLTLRKKADATGSRRWAVGTSGARYVAAVRGGPSGVKTTAGLPLNPDQAIALVIPNLDLTQANNQPPGGLPAALVPALEGLRAALWQPLSWSDVGGAWTPAGAAVTPAFKAVDAAFPHDEVAAITAFGVAPSGTVALIDPGSGVAPLPIDLLRTGPNGTIANNPGFGAVAAGLATLDGFSTTGMAFAQTSFPIDVGTVTGANVFLYKLGGTTPTLLRELKFELGKAAAGDPTANPAAAAYVAMPTPIVIPQNANLAPGVPCPAAAGCSPAIGLQPAVPAAVPGVGNFFLPPLDEASLYAVVITKRVKDIAGNPLAKSTVAKIILDAVNDPSAGGHSLLSGVDDATASALTAMRAELAPVFAALPTGTTKADLVTAYTFRTQSITGTSLALSAMPYSIEAGAGAAIFTPTGASSIPLATLAAVGAATAGVSALYDVTFTSLDAIDKTTGTLRATLSTDVGSPAKLATLLAPLHALVVLPSPAAVPACPAGFPAGALCAKLVVFGHGLNGSKETLYAVASSLASQGFVAAAIDFPLHGLRNWCSANSQCTTGTADGVCTPFPGGAGQGDALVPGTCTTGVPKEPANSRYFISANFFRIRDAFRQNLIDQSALVLALSRPPSSPQPPGNPFAAALPTGVLVDPTAIYYEGISLGSLSGTSVIATNPRIARAVLSVGGGTAVDVFTQSPTFQPPIDALLATIIPGYSRPAITVGNAAFDPTVAANYLKTINVAKWIVDPGDPINFARSVVTAPLPNLLANPNGSVAQPSKQVFAQVALGDIVVPNAFNFELDTLLGVATTTYADDSPPNGPAPHSMLATIPAVAQDAALYLLNTTTPPAQRQVPVLP
jgi:hypothetical protein